jgi:hypothetical protein
MLVITWIWEDVLIRTCRWISTSCDGNSCIVRLQRRSRFDSESTDLATLENKIRIFKIMNLSVDVTPTAASPPQMASDEHGIRTPSLKIQGDDLYVA